MQSSAGAVSYKDGVWRYNVRIGGRRVRQSGFKTEAQALEAMRRAKAGKALPKKYKKHKQKKKKRSTFWTEDRLEVMRDSILPKSRTVEEALRRATDKWGKFNRSYFSIKFKSRFGHAPGSYLGIEAGAAIDPFADLPPNLNPTVLLQRNKELEKEIQTLSKAANARIGYRAQIEELICGVRNTTLSPPRWLVESKPGEAHHGVPTLALGDIHFAEQINAKQSLSGKPYNCAIAKARIQHTVQSACQLLGDRVLSRTGYPGIILALLGDLFAGYIHPELRETAEMPLLPSVTVLLEIIVAAVDLLLAEFGHVYIPCVVGNHSRLDIKPRCKNATQDNVEWIFYYFLRQHYRLIGEDRVYVDVPDTFEHRYKVYNTRYLITHGAEFTGGTGITGPLLPWTRGYQKKQQQSHSVSQWTDRSLDFDVMALGHWHRYFHGDTFVVNGPIVEMGEFAHRIQAPYAPSCSALWFTHRRKGVTIKLPVYAEPGVSLRPDTDDSASWVEVFKH